MEGSPKNKVKIPGRQFLIVGILALLAVGFLDNQMVGEPKGKPVNEKKDNFVYWASVASNNDKTISSYIKELEKFNEIGIDGILIEAETDYDVLEQIKPIARREGLTLYVMSHGKNILHSSTELENWTYSIILNQADKMDMDWVGHELNGIDDKNKFFGGNFESLPSTKEFESAIVEAKNKGAQGVVVFNASKMPHQHFEVLKKLKDTSD
ncbi:MULTISPECIES: hypothetical protein [Flavobacteriaceae]|uniref:hypothetical protein n=1 Tax=Flavobacteriaceae TaxID=49546 RepID=UPI0014919BF6|nr:MULTISPECIES: hypothetical protein [Allomuricauda]MDC6366776.1 hypothetical protein [Muricauda sp. AC10]